MATFNEKSTLAEVRAALIQERDRLQAKVDLFDALIGLPTPAETLQDVLQRQEAKPRPRTRAKAKKRPRASQGAWKPAKKNQRRNMAEPARQIFNENPTKWWEAADVVRETVDRGLVDIPAEDMRRAIDVFQITLAKWCREGKYERQDGKTGRKEYRPKQAGS